MKKPAVAFLVAAAVVAAGAPSPAERVAAPAQPVALSGAADGPPVLPQAAKRRRPTDAPAGGHAALGTPTDLDVFNDFSTPARAHSSRRAVVHYVVRGAEAPPLNDDDANGVPDYVERVGEAADRAIQEFEQRGFRPIRSDEGGPDGRPDLYISRFAPGTFGVAFPAARAQGGAFVAVSNALDPGREHTLASLVGTVTHEIFHLVQFAYFPPGADPELPAWVLEGSAAAVERRLYPALSDVVWDLQLRRWFRAPHSGLARQSYGAQLLWHELDARAPRLLPAVLAAFGRSPGADEQGIRTVARVYASAAREPFAVAFHRYALRVADEYADSLAPAGTLSRPGTGTRSVAPLGIHYVRVRTPGTVTVRLGRPALRASLAYQVESRVAGNPSVQRLVRARSADGGRTLTFTPRPAPRAGGRVAHVTLVLSNGGPRPLRYTVRTS